jgi:predicted nucleotide-binding protein
MAMGNVFDQINNAVLDLQSAEYQTFERPLKALTKLLHHEDLQPYNEKLVAHADLDAFLKDNERGGGMVGSDVLSWPEEPEAYLGIALQLIERFAADPNFMVHFGHTYFNPGTKLIMSVRSVVGQLIIPFARDYKDYVMNQGLARPLPRSMQSTKVFIVHGHDGEARESVARFIERIGFEAVILHEQANQGRTVIEKVEAASDVGFAVVLLTPDDEGRRKGDPALEDRARQNVILELGYFMGRLGRSHVCALRKGAVNIPSDFAGVVWTDMDSANGWQTTLARELDAAGYPIDWNAVMRRSA